MKSAALATGLCLGGGIVGLTAVFARAQINSDGFSWAAIGTSVSAAIFWSALVLVGTCYFSIPIATLLVAGTTMLVREIRQVIDNNRARRASRTTPPASGPGPSNRHVT